jgi:hypothetical protein
MIADYLDKAIEAIEHLSPSGAHEVAAVIADNELPHEGDLQLLVINLKKLSKHPIGETHHTKAR